MTGVLSISNNKYEPPCKSKPRLIFLFKKSLLNLKILDEANKIKNKVNKETKIILNLEKYNTLLKRNLFFNFLRIH